MRPRLPRRLTATRPGEMGWRTWAAAGWRTYQLMDERNLGLISAGVAFYGLLSLFPALGAAIAIWGFLADPDLLREQIELMHGIVPDSAFGILEAQVNDLTAAQSGSTLQWASVLSILVALWSARASVAALIRGLNVIYDERNRQSAIMRIVTAYALTALLVLVGLAALGAVVLIPALLAIFPPASWVVHVLAALRWAVLLLMVYAAVVIVMRYGPNRRRAQLKWVTPGALGSVLFWAAGSIAFSVYLRNFDRFNEVYGSLGAVIALLFWFYLSALLLLLGAQFDAELERSTTQDTTAGPDRMPGNREAHVADHTVDDDGVERRADAVLYDAEREAEPDR